MGRHEILTDRAEDDARHPRKATLLIAQCERSDGRVAAIRIRNLSDTGLGGRCDHVADFAVDEAVRMRFPNLAPISARVIWVKKGQIGVEFVNPVNQECLADARAMLARVTP